MTESRAMAKRLALGFFACCAAYAMPSVAGRPTMQECLEGSDFIHNAALSRDAGIAAESFIERMKEDFFAIRAFPNDLRWFAHDQDDEAFLADQARVVFEQPAIPDEHRTHFLRACLDRMAQE